MVEKDRQYITGVETGGRDWRSEIRDRGPETGGDVERLKLVARRLKPMCAAY
jgi:hypothetical protein